MKWFLIGGAIIVILFLYSMLKVAGEEEEFLENNKWTGNENDE